MIPIYTMIRLLAVACTATLMGFFPRHRELVSVVYAVAFGHYALATYYSARRIKLLSSTAATGAGLVGLLAFSFGITWAGVPVLAYFLVHHTINEAYAVARPNGALSAAELKALRISSVLVHASMYASVYRARVVFNGPLFQALLAVFCASLLVHLVLATRTFSKLNWVQRIELVGGELIALGVVAASFEWRFNVYHVALYHFVFWIFFPLVGLSRKPSGARIATLGYATGTLVLTAFFFFLTPLARTPISLDPQLLEFGFVALSNLHISLSFALSDTNPSFVRAWFRIPKVPKTALG